MKKWFWAVPMLVVGSVAGLLIWLQAFMPNVGPPPILKVGADSALVARGRYLAHHVMVCMDCHSTRDWTRFAGPVKGQALGQGGEVFSEEFGFPGRFTSKNITPFKLASWTDGEIMRAITCGVNKDGQALFPVMPYLRYGQADERDVQAVIAYLRTLAPIASEVEASVANFPMNFILNTIPQPARLTPAPDPANVVEHGRYLTNIAACEDCHTKQEQGKPLPGMSFAGGMEFALPGFGTVRAANITPDAETGIGQWTEEAFVRRFKAYADSSYTPPAVPQGYFNTVMPWMMYAGMSEQDLAAIYQYLKTVPPVAQKVTHFTSASPAAGASR